MIASPIVPAAVGFDARDVVAEGIDADVEIELHERAVGAVASGCCHRVCRR
jgi:hypothetical protein